MQDGLAIKKGDTVKVSQKITEGKRDRVVVFKGQVLQIKGSGLNVMFTVRQTLEGVDVDRIFPLASPTIAKIEKIEERASKARSSKKRRKKTVKK